MSKPLLIAVVALSLLATPALAKGAAHAAVAHAPHIFTGKTHSAGKTLHIRPSAHATTTSSVHGILAQLIGGRVK